MAKAVGGWIQAVVVSKLRSREWWGFGKWWDALAHNASRPDLSSSEHVLWRRAVSYAKTSPVLMATEVSLHRPNYDSAAQLRYRVIVQAASQGCPAYVIKTNISKRARSTSQIRHAVSDTELRLPSCISEVDSW
jgi:hypothetical protein